MKEADVFILGGGLSGVAAAVGAARAGAKVFLAERAYILGGTSTLSLVTPMQTFHAGGRRVIGGAAQEMIERLARRGATPGHLPDPVGFASSVTPVDPDALKIFLSEWLTSEGVHVALGHSLRELRMSGGSITSAVIEDQQGGAAEVKAGCFVDASGNGDMSLMAGCDMEIDDNCQPMTLIFIMDRVETGDIIEYQKAHPGEFYMNEDPAALERGYVGVSGFFPQVEKARADGRLDIMRDRLLFFGTARSGEIAVNTTRVTGWNALYGEELSRAMMEGQRQVGQVAAFMKEEIPGFRQARLARVADWIGVRETRRLAGRYVMNEKDVLACRHFDDVVAKGAYPMDIHLGDSDGLESRLIEGKGYYDIPLRSLLNGRAENLVTVGKCISVTHEGFSSTRVMPTCMAVGQAGGVAAALHARSGADFEDLSGRIQDTLRAQRAIVFDEDTIPDRL